MMTSIVADASWCKNLHRIAHSHTQLRRTARATPAPGRRPLSPQ
jgi:hypothetical protein